MAASHRTTTELDGRTLSLSNLDKPLFPSGFTKAEVIQHYLTVAEVMLPHVADRAMTRIRFPDGVDGPQFYEKNEPAGCPEWVRRATVLTSDGPIRYVVADDRATLVWLAGLAALEMHVPQWRLASAEVEDDTPITLPASDATGERTVATEPLSTTLVVDCDPGPGVTMVESALGALLVAATLAEGGLTPTVRTSGGKGLQLYAAIAPTPGPRVVQQARALARQLTARHPELFVATVAKAERSGRIFLDYNQNLTGRNTVAAYSLRAARTPWVATPLTWAEVEQAAGASPGPDLLRFSPDDVAARIAEHGDLAAPSLPSPDAPALPRWSDASAT